MKAILIIGAITGIHLSMSVASFGQKGFTPGNIAVLRIGGVNGNNGLPPASLFSPDTIKASPIHIDEYAPSGKTFKYIRSINLPAMVSPHTAAIFNTGNKAEGYVTSSGDGRFLTVMGYDTTDRIIARVDYEGRVDLSTRLKHVLSPGAYPFAMPEGVTSDDGTRFWLGSNQALKGVAFTSLGSAQMITTVSLSESAVSSLGIFGGDLYGVSGFHQRIFLVGATGGLPTITGSHLSTFMQFNTGEGPTDRLPFKPSQMVLFDLDPDIPGMDVMYISNCGASSTSAQYGIYKFYKDTNNIWQAAGGYDHNPAGPGYFGITGKINEAGNPVLYVTTLSVAPSGSNNHLKEIIDTATKSTSYDSMMKPILNRDLSNNGSKPGGIIRGISLVPMATGAAH